MATSRPKPNVVVWEWMNEYGRWRPYDPQVADFIESNSFRTPTQINLGTVDNSLSSYAIDFQTMCQIRYGTGTARPIRRSLYPSDSPPGKGVVWQWEGDIKGQWHTYDMEVACVIEDYFSQNAQSPGSLDLSKTSVGLPYIIDFNHMVQQRIQTGKKRPLRREILPQPYPVQGQSGSNAVSQKRGISSTTLNNSCGHNSASKIPRLNSTSQNGQQINTSQNQTFTVNPTCSHSAASGQPFPAISSVQSSNSNSNTGHLFSSSANLSNANTFVSAMLPGNSSAFTNVLGANTQSAFTNVSGGNSRPLTRRQYNAAAGSITQQSSPVIPLHPNVMPNLNYPPHQMALNFPGSTAPNSSNMYASNLHGPPSNQGNQIPSFMNHISNNGNQTHQGFSSGIVNLHGMSSLSTMNGYLPGGSSATGGSSSSGSIPVPGATNILMSPAVPLLMSPQSTLGATSSNTKHLDLPQEARIPNNVPKNTKKHQSSGITAEDVFQRYITPVTNPPDEEDCCICCERLSHRSGYGDATHNVQHDCCICCERLSHRSGYRDATHNVQHDCCICCERLSHPSGYGDGKPEDKIVYQLSKCNHIFHKLCVFAMYNSGSKEISSLNLLD
ncbi:hypothetical protein KUTeg_009398 [Tegillarca granosa]|uniref:E3 ubiquitin-protein ligase n=1 Tax=Tegillarca granosa TaxID=220873 RepID=A0ABQ9F6X7_TEGGR|nr:hypothetical protein KUTeg_009398 [Tegillarca granosa]